MLSLDVEQFWKDDEKAHLDNCFSKGSPQVALGIRMSNECVFAELGEVGELWGNTDPQRRYDLNRRYNDKAEKIVGRRLLRETPPTPPDSIFPPYRQIGEVFGGKYTYYRATGDWLEGSIDNEEDLIRTLDRIDSMDIRSFILPQNWEDEKTRIYEKYGKRPAQYTAVRGPVTLATSVLGVENLIFLIYDNPELALRFSETIAKVILEYIKIFIEESGHTEGNFRHGFSFYDDNCCLLTREMYELFGAPVLKKVFDFAAPNPSDNRFQHSDSAMGHIIPVLASFNLTGCNFGPTVTVSEIRKHMPHTRIDGQLAPFTFMRNNEDEIIAEVRRDCEMARENDARGLNLSTAGSINNGSLLTSMRVVMAAIQNYGKY